jgi:uncharacterized protein YeaO (DUF488 family)
MIKTGRRFDKKPLGDLYLVITIGGTALGRKLAPDRDVLMKYKNDEITWEGFEYLYLEKIQKMWDNRDEAIVTVARFVKDPRTLWLLCYESESNPKCHRHLLKKFLEEHVEELDIDKSEKDAII